MTLYPLLLLSTFEEIIYFLNHYRSYEQLIIYFYEDCLFLLI